MDWTEAAKRYQAHRQREAMSAQKQADVQAAAALREFLGSAEGVAALELLAASGRFIRLAEENQGDGYGVVFYLGGTGLHQSYEAMGTWIAYADKIPEPHIKPVTPEEAAEAVFTPSRSLVPPERRGDLVAWLGEQLDGIAAQVPSGY